MSTTLSVDARKALAELKAVEDAALRARSATDGVGTGTAVPTARGPTIRLTPLPTFTARRTSLPVTEAAISAAGLRTLNSGLFPTLAGRVQTAPSAPPPASSLLPELDHTPFEAARHRGRTMAPRPGDGGEGGVFDLFGPAAANRALTSFSGFVKNPGAAGSLALRVFAAYAAFKTVTAVGLKMGEVADAGLKLHESEGYSVREATRRELASARERLLLGARDAIIDAFFLAGEAAYGGAQLASQIISGDPSPQDTVSEIRTVRRELQLDRDMRSGEVAKRLDEYNRAAFERQKTEARQAIESARYVESRVRAAHSDFLGQMQELTAGGLPQEAVGQHGANVFKLFEAKIREEAEAEFQAFRPPPAGLNWGYVTGKTDKLKEGET